MNVQVAPERVEDLDLMKRLAQYSDGSASWTGEAQPPRMIEACKRLHSDLRNLVTNAVDPILNRTTAREMEAFTAHDPAHARKVAHLMWAILPPERRDTLTPVEIGLLVGAAYLHDMGMGIGEARRRELLTKGSDLYLLLGLDSDCRHRLDELFARGAAAESDDKLALAREAALAEESLLCRYLRQTHADRQTYRELLEGLEERHRTKPEAIPSPRAAFAFDGQSFLERLIDICFSHGQSAAELARLPAQVSAGGCLGDARLAAAALRLADILDFDRERTPEVLHHYLLPTPVAHDRERSALEWAKHLSITAWSIDSDAVRFHGATDDHVVHHAVTEFLEDIRREIAATRAALAGINIDWPFRLPGAVEGRIEGAHQPFRFQLDEARIFHLLMGNKIYDTPLAAIRELVQNAVDACLLRDRLTLIDDDAVRPAADNRIVIRYIEPDSACPWPRLEVKDTGTGMDAEIIQEYFLKIGRSYYSSSEFNKDAARLRRAGQSFCPVSEFGIGFLSCFMLADKVVVDTAHWRSPRGDARRRVVTMDGPTRLLALRETEDNPTRKGTTITLTLTKGGKNGGSPKFGEVLVYLYDVCQDLPYTLTVHGRLGDNTRPWEIAPRGHRVDLPPEFEPAALRLELEDAEWGLKGEMVIYDKAQAEAIAKAGIITREVAAGTVVITEKEGQMQWYPRGSVLICNGFALGKIPGFEARTPWEFSTNTATHSTSRLCLMPQEDARDRSTPLVARTGLEASDALAQKVTELWLTQLIEHWDHVRAEHLDAAPMPQRQFNWGSLAHFSALEVYPLVRMLLGEDCAEAWENGGAELRWPSRSEGILAGNLAARILPLIAGTAVTFRGGYWMPAPDPNWRDILRRNHDWPTREAGRPDFAVYLEPMKIWLYRGDVRTSILSAGDRIPFNEAFRERFPPLPPGSHESLKKALDALLEARHKCETPRIERDDFDLLKILTAALPDALVGGAIHTPASDFPFFRTQERLELVGPWPLGELMGDFGE